VATTATTTTETDAAAEKTILDSLETRASELSIWELRQIEAKPKTAAGKAVDWLLRLLPLIVSLLIIAQYKFAPNFKEFKPLDKSKPTNLWVWFIGFFAAILLARVFISLFSLLENVRFRGDKNNSRWNRAILFSKRTSQKLRRNAPIYTAVFILLFAYDWATLKTGRLPQPYFPWPDAILNAMISDRVILWKSVWHSLILLFIGYSSGGLAGLVTGIAAGWSEKARYWVWPVVKVLGPIPSTTWLPIILIVASSLFGGSVFLIALGVWYPVTMTTMTGVLNIPKSNFEAARTFGATKAALIFKVAIPASSPFIFQGLTQGMSIACTALLVAEMMGVEAGLGWYINWQRGWAEFAKMYAAVIIICLTFFLVNALFSFIKKRVLRWKEGGVV
jgi:NitT/TauT family transport system permease protein